MTDPCKKSESSVACLEKRVAHACAEKVKGEPSDKCKQLKKKELKARLREGLITEQEFNRGTAAFVKETERKLDAVRGAMGATGAAFAIINQGLDTWNDIVAASNQGHQCKQLSPDEINAILEDEEDGWYTRVLYDWWLPLPEPVTAAINKSAKVAAKMAGVEPGADNYPPSIRSGVKVGPLIDRQCHSDIMAAAKGSGADIGIETLYSLWDELIKTRKISDCTSPYFTRFFNFVPYTFYISQLLMKMSGDALMAMADMAPDDRKRLEVETPCGMDTIEEVLKKGIAGRLPEIPQIPHIPPIPYIKIPSVMDTAKNAGIDGLCWTVCTLMEPLMAMIAQTMEGLFKEAMQLTTPDDTAFSMGLAPESQMPELKKIDLSSYFTSEILSQMINDELVAEDALIADIREYISYVTRDLPMSPAAGPRGLPPITQRQVVYLLMGQADCKVLNILTLVGMDKGIMTQYLEKYIKAAKKEAIKAARDEAYDKAAAGILDPAKKIYAGKKAANKAEKELLATGIKDHKLFLELENFDSLWRPPKVEDPDWLGPDAGQIVSFWKYLGDNINIFDVIEESKKDVCIPDFCIEKDKQTVEDFIQFNKDLCSLLNPEFGLPDLNLSNMFAYTGAGAMLIKSIEVQLGALFDMSSDIFNVPSGKETLDRWESELGHIFQGLQLVRPEANDAAAKVACSEPNDNVAKCVKSCVDTGTKAYAASWGKGMPDGGPEYKALTADCFLKCPDYSNSQCAGKCAKKGALYECERATFGAQFIKYYYLRTLGAAYDHDNDPATEPETIKLSAEADTLIKAFNSAYLRNISLMLDYAVDHGVNSGLIMKLPYGLPTKYTNSVIKEKFNKQMKGKSLKDVGPEIERFSGIISGLGMNKNYRETMAAKFEPMRRELDKKRAEKAQKKLAAAYAAAPTEPAA